MFDLNDDARAATIRSLYPSVTGAKPRAKTNRIPIYITKRTKKAAYIQGGRVTDRNWGKTPGTQLQQNKGQSGSVTLPP